MVPATQFGSKTPVLKNLRHLLRVTRKRSTHESIKTCQWSQFILSQFRERQAESNPQKIRAYREEAVDAATMLSGVEEQKHLWFLDTGAEKQLTSQEIVRRSAHRVGLIIPDTLTNPDHHSLSDAKEKARIYTLKQSQIKNQ
uniref:Uncharacterized protein AlNc14C148G7440 n=1 Tax=Albugo laibachii Nc14 TaxID=890382 RepID=F0WLQ8_9STRA|nr:conserved hypothetical protein [Albugo laibachii Nc14]|eukprot:CCA22230.1 conserved hypothetical protein [Albugo laibachii Nc14]